ncbi:MAG: TonB-dependent receptor [Chitinophagales bacterium]
MHTMAQQIFKVQGKVIDSVSGNPLEFVSVSLFSNNQWIAGATTIASGEFDFEKVTAGSYSLRVNLLGYEPLQQPVNVQGDTTLQISLRTVAKQLKEVSVAATKPVITRNSEKTVLNVAQSPTYQTGTAEDVLMNMPGVSLDQKGNVSMVGKQGVKIYVDGKPSVMAQTNLQAFLKSLPANAIESIELITNPSARYEANGNAGIINIKLKKGKADGLNGTASLAYGLTKRINGNLTLNYRKNKLNLFASYATNWQHIGHEFNETRKISVGDSVTVYQLHNPSTEKSLNHNVKAGFDYFINDKNTFTYTGNINIGHNQWPGTSHSVNHSENGNVLQQYESQSLSVDDNFSLTNNFAFSKSYDTTERKLDVQFTQTYVNGRSANRLSSMGFDGSGIIQPANSLYRNSYPKNNIHNFIFQLDYSEPLKLKGQKLETGLRNETTLNNNVFEVYDSLGGAYRRNALLSNGFRYTENIAAFYIILSGEATKWLTYAAGLRTEHTLIKSSTGAVERNYLSLFPNASLNAAINEMHNVSISYSRRVQRPSFQQLNNSITYFDQYSTWEGNPYLRPTFVHNVSASYTAMVKQHMFSINAEGYFSKDIFNESTRIDENRIARGGVINGGSGQGFNASFYMKVQVTKWMELQLNNIYMLQHFDFKEGVNTGPVTGSAYQLWGDVNFKFWKNTVLDINGLVNTGEAFIQGRTKPWGMLNASIRKSFFKDHFTVALSGQNLLDTEKWAWYVNNTSLHTEGSWKNINRTVFLTLTYTFGKNKNALKRKNLEQNERLNGGGGKK